MSENQSTNEQPAPAAPARTASRAARPAAPVVTAPEPAPTPEAPKPQAEVTTSSGLKLENF